MENKKLHKLDSIFSYGISSIASIAGMADGFYWKDVEYGGFPVFSCMSVFISYALWIVLLIYSSFKHKDEKDKSKYVRWYIYFVLPFIHILFATIGLIISNLIISVFGL